MSSVWGKLFGNRPTPANDAHHLSNHYEPDNETSEAWDASSNGWGHGHRRGGDPPAMIARSFELEARRAAAPGRTRSGRPASLRAARTPWRRGAALKAINSGGPVIRQSGVCPVIRQFGGRGARPSPPRRALATGRLGSAGRRRALAGGGGRSDAFPGAAPTNSSGEYGSGETPPRAPGRSRDPRR